MTNATHKVFDTGVFRVSLFVLAFMIPTTAGYASSSPSPADSVHFCLPLDHNEMRARDSIYAASKQALNLNVGSPRTVRMIYFLPNDRHFRASVVDSMKRIIRQIQTFYGEQMQAHGYGYRSFAVESDASGEPIVHRLDGQHPDSHYLDHTHRKVLEEGEQVFDRLANIFLFVVDNSSNVIGTSDGRRVAGVGGNIRKFGGQALVTSSFSFKTAAHELGHAFGLSHDFRDNAHIMSYGGSGRYRLSDCNARFLEVHPYLNNEIPIEEDEGEVGPTRELLPSQEYPAGTGTAPVRIRVSDSKGLHQVLLFVITREPHPAAGSREVKICRALEGVHDAVVEFAYDGAIPSRPGTSLSNPERHELHVEAVDIEGNVGHMRFGMMPIPPNRIGTLVHSSEGFFPDVESVAFSPDGKFLASGSAQGTVKLWNVATQRIIRTLHDDGSVWSVVFSPDGTILASLSDDVNLWDVSTGQKIATLFSTYSSGALAFSPDGTILASGSRNKVRLWHVRTRQNIATLVHGQIGPGLYTVAFSSDNSILASGSHDGKIKLWSVANYQEIASLDTHSDAVLSVAFSPDGKLLASAEYTEDPTDYSLDSSVKLWDIETKRDVATIEADTTVYGYTYRFRSVAFSPSGTFLATGSADNTVKLWDVETGRKVASLGHANHSGCIGGVHSVSFSPSGTIIASGAHIGNCGGYNGATLPWRGEVHLWDVSSFEQDVSQATFSISVDGDSAPGDQGVTTLDVTTGSVVPIQLIGNNIREVNGVSAKFEFDATQVGYDGFDPGNLLPNAQVLAVPATNPTAIDISVVSFGGQATDDSGLVGSVRFRTTDGFSGSTIRLVSAEIGRGNERESITPSDIAVTLRLAQLTPDFNGDGKVDFGDFVAFGMRFGASRGDARFEAKYDLDQDGMIGFGDFLIFGREFGSGG